jgi:hypothetical protein
MLLIDKFDANEILFLANQISLEVKELATKARERKLMPKDYEGGSFQKTIRWL